MWILTIWRKKNAGDIPWFAEILANQSIWTTRYKTRTLFLLLQIWFAKTAWKLPIQQTHFLLQITCASTWTRLSPWTWQQNILLKCWNTTLLCGTQTQRNDNYLKNWQEMWKPDMTVQVHNWQFLLNKWISDPNGLSDSFHLLPETHHRHCPVRIKVTGTISCTVQAIRTAILQISGYVWNILIQCLANK
jgi:hypothetical protein